MNNIVERSKMLSNSFQNWTKDENVVENCQKHQYAIEDAEKEKATLGIIKNWRHYSHGLEFIEEISKDVHMNNIMERSKMLSNSLQNRTKDKNVVENCEKHQYAIEDAEKERHYLNHFCIRGHKQRLLKRAGKGGGSQISRNLPSKKTTKGEGGGS